MTDLPIMGLCPVSTSDRGQTVQPATAAPRGRQTTWAEHRGRFIGMRASVAPGVVGSEAGIVSLGRM